MSDLIYLIDLPAPPQPSLADLQAQLAVIQAQISALVSKG